MSNVRVKLNSPQITYHHDFIATNYVSETLRSVKDVYTGTITVFNCSHSRNHAIKLTFFPPQIERVAQTINYKVSTNVQKCGVMLVGFGALGMALTKAILSKKLLNINRNQATIQPLNVSLSLGMDETGRDLEVSLADLLPLTDLSSLAVDGWDLNDRSIYERICAHEEANTYHVQQLKAVTQNMKPRSGIDDTGLFQRKVGVNNLKPELLKWRQVESIRADICHFKKANKLDQVFVVWCVDGDQATREIRNVNDSAFNLLDAIRNDNFEVNNATLYAVAAILEGSTFINASQHKVATSGLVELGEQRRTLVLDCFQRVHEDVARDQVVERNRVIAQCVFDTIVTSELLSRVVFKVTGRRTFKELNVEYKAKVINSLFDNWLQVLNFFRSLLSLPATFGNTANNRYLQIIAEQTRLGVGNNDAKVSALEKRSSDSSSDSDASANGNTYVRDGCSSPELSLDGRTA